ncbi:MAG: MBL fold metallo-hydrolase [Nevskiaceae bacterium]|jgi:glyoxylase-like metal-dependent hydrolase (beta-lactamase superfamily II)|nr:MBL fold metallo-hydrolase [Nevskiaceae bacterium]
MTISRRNFLRDSTQVLSCASLLGVSGLASAAAKPRIEVKDVNGLALFTGAGGNVVALPSPEGALLIDGGLAANSAALLKAVASNTGSKRISTLINTHWHPEQTGSNEAVGKTGAKIISHEVTRLALARKNNPSALVKGAYGGLPKEALPTVTTYNTGSLEVAGETVDYRYLPAAHTNGDLLVHFPKHNVIVAGGPVAGNEWPVIDWIAGGFYHGFLRSYEILAELAKPDTLVIGAAGEPLTGAEIARRKDIYWELFKQFFILFNVGFGPEDVVAFNAGQEFVGVTPVVADRPLKDLIEKMGDPAQFLECAYRGLQQATLPH